MEENFIDIVVSNPKLKNKIHLDIAEPSDTIYWYIRFNIPLDAFSVSSKTMNVTDTSGYLMKTWIRYDEDKNLIIIHPLEPYVQNEYYLLNISKKVQSKRGQMLKNEIHILFKLINNEISDFQILKSTVKTPKPRNRPKDYFKRFEEEKLANEKLPLIDIQINFFISLIGIALLVVMAILRSPILALISVVVLVIGIGHIFIQIFNHEARSTFSYNKGARFYNTRDYEKASKYFNKALVRNSNNNYAWDGIQKLKGKILTGTYEDLL